VAVARPNETDLPYWIVDSGSAVEPGNVEIRP
jgi:hypothetical protein